MLKRNRFNFSRNDRIKLTLRSGKILFRRFVEEQGSSVYVTKLESREGLEKIHSDRIRSAHLYKGLTNGKVR